MINKSVIQKQKYFAADFCKSLGKQLISIINQYGGARDVSSLAVAVAVACAFGPGVVVLISHALLSLHFVFTRKKNLHYEVRNVSNYGSSSASHHMPLVS